MTTNIVDFSKAKKKAEKASRVAAARSKNQKVKPSTPNEIFTEVYEKVVGRWEEYAIKNRLSEYVEARLPKFARAIAPSDYINDLNTISNVEQRLGMKVVVFSPGTATFNSHGWLAGFHRGTDIFSTPPGMVSEANARALNILLWLEFEDAMKGV